MTYKIKRSPAGEEKKKKQADEKYERIMKQFGSIEAYQEAKSHKKPTVIKKPKKQEPEGYKGGGIAQRGLGRAFNKGGKV
jgi:hypothetical protein